GVRSNVFTIYKNGNLVTDGDISGADITASDNFIASLGAEGTPSYTFTGLEDTGMYAPDANSLGFTINGSQVLVINPTETVIVGNLEPFDDNTLDLGHPGWRWRNLFLSDDASIGGDISCVDITASGTITDGTATILGGNILTIGTLGAGASSVTHTGDGRKNTAYITLTAEALTVGASATLGVGLLVYNLPAGNITITNCFLSVALAGVTILDDTPEFGVGTVIASGTVSDLGTPATFENIMIGAAMTDTNGTVDIRQVATVLNVLTGGAHTVHVNFADIWGANTDAVAAITGLLRIDYVFNEA
ncbi:hypothetical protein LCGC14_2688850, partial [marine sediment metagenome]